MPDARGELHFAQCADQAAGGGNANEEAYLALWRRQSACVASGTPVPKEPKRHRVKTYEVGICLENLLVQTTTHGLIIFVVPEEDLKKIRAGNWRKVAVQKWPRLNLFPDEGSDMRALVAALQGKTFNLNCYCDNDKSHGLSNNHQGAARKAGQLPFMNLYLQ